MNENYYFKKFAGDGRELSGVQEAAKKPKFLRLDDKLKLLIGNTLPEDEKINYSDVGQLGSIAKVLSDAVPETSPNKKKILELANTGLLKNPNSSWFRDYVVKPQIAGALGSIATTIPAAIATYGKPELAILLGSAGGTAALGLAALHSGLVTRPRRLDKAKRAYNELRRLVAQEKVLDLSKLKLSDNPKEPGHADKNRLITALLKKYDLTKKI